MSVAIITGSSGLVGSEACRFFHSKGFDVVGIDNNLRSYFFGNDGSVSWNTRALRSSLSSFVHYDKDIRSEPEMRRIFARFGKDVSVVVHAAAQPSHDWAAKEPLTDFSVNATGTLVLLEAVREHCPEAAFIFTSTNKVYGDTPNHLPLIEQQTRWEISNDHPFSEHGIDESMSIDRSKHSVFGVSKVAADVMTQEYGRYFGLKTGVFRGGCLTGPSHSGAQLHGFLAYLVKCVVERKHYTVFGYKGKQVRDNIHSNDLVSAFWHFFLNPQSGAVYNMGGGRHSNCSVLEAIALAEEVSGEELSFDISDAAREGDHIWWISDTRKFQQDYPDWQYEYSLESIVREIVDATRDRTRATARLELVAA